MEDYFNWVVNKGNAFTLIFTFLIILIEVLKSYGFSWNFLRGQSVF